MPQKLEERENTIRTLRREAADREKVIALLKKDVGEREESIADKERRMAELKAKNKVRYLLQHAICLLSLARRLACR